MEELIILLYFPEQSVNYEKKNPIDKSYLHTKADSDAPVWHIYNEESRIFDAAMVTEASTNLDILLLFVCAVSSSIGDHHDANLTV